MEKEKINNMFIWIGIALALSGFSYQCLLLFIGDGTESPFTLAELCYLGSWICFIVDYWKLKEMDVAKPHWIWVILYGLFPVYLWKRASLFDWDRRPFWVCVGGYVLLFAIYVLAVFVGETTDNMEGQPFVPEQSQTQQPSLPQATVGRGQVAGWVKSMGGNFQSLGLASATIPVYYNAEANGFLSIFELNSTAYIIASSINESRFTTCELFTEVAAVNNSLVLASCPDAEVLYNRSSDVFVMDSGCDQCGMGATMRGRYSRVASVAFVVNAEGLVSVQKIE